MQKNAIYLFFAFFAFFSCRYFALFNSFFFGEFILKLNVFYLNDKIALCFIKFTIKSYSKKFNNKKPLGWIKCGENEY